MAGEYNQQTIGVTEQKVRSEGIECRKMAVVFFVFKMELSNAVFCSTIQQNRKMACPCGTKLKKERGKMKKELIEREIEKGFQR